MAHPKQHVHDPGKPDRRLEVKVRLTPEEHEQLREYAQRSGRTLTAAVRQAILRELVQWEHTDSITMASLRFAAEVRRLLRVEEAAE